MSAPLEREAGKLRPDGYICPGAVYEPPSGQERCLCGQPRERHLFERVGLGFREIPEKLEP
jgi:hypothetical protein